MATLRSEKQRYFFEKPTQDQRARTRDACMTDEAVRRSTKASRPLSIGTKIQGVTQQTRSVDPMLL